MYFGGHIFQDPDAGHWESLKATVGELRELSPVFLAPAMSAKVQLTGGEKVSTLLKEYGGDLWLIAANRDVPPANVTFALPFRPVRVAVRFEGRTLAPTGNGFQDRFPRYGVHVYRISR